MHCSQTRSQLPEASSGAAKNSASATNTAWATGAATSSDAAVPSNPEFAPILVKASGRAMGTHLAFAGYTTEALSERAVEDAWNEAVKEIQRLEALMTTWNEASVLSNVNRNAHKGPVKVDPETFYMIEESLRIHALSEGAFDVTFETLHGLWKFDEDLDPHPPSKSKIDAVLPYVGSKHLRLDKAALTVAIDNPKTKIGLGGIAKGYAVDKAAEVLSKKGVRSFYFQAGGDLFAKGRKADGTEWRAGIRDPRGPGWPEPKYFAILSLSDHAFSTAGDYERSYVVDGVRYHHILDPRTGLPGRLCKSVTIWAPTALLADELDDAVFLLGPEKGMKLVEATDGVGAVIVDAANRLWVSDRLRGKLVLTATPSDGI